MIFGENVYKALMLYKSQPKPTFHMFRFKKNEVLYGYHDVEQWIGCFGVPTLAKKPITVKVMKTSKYIEKWMKIIQIFVLSDNQYIY